MKKVAWKNITRFEGPEQSPGFLLWKVSTRWHRELQTALTPLDLTLSQFVLLANLGWTTRSGTDISQVELARHAGTDITMTSQVLRSLEKKGLIKRVQRKGDARSKFPQVTERGVALVEEAVPLVEAVDKNFFNSLGKDVKKYVELLQQLNP